MSMLNATRQMSAYAERAGVVLLARCLLNRSTAFLLRIGAPEEAVRM